MWAPTRTGPQPGLGPNPGQTKQKQNKKEKTDDKARDVGGSIGNAHIAPAQQYSPLGEALVDIEKGPEPPVKAPEEREAAETQLVQEFWFNELTDAVGDVTNMVSIVRNSNLAAVYGL